MKVVLFNGSMHEEGNTYCALLEMAKIFESEGIETEILCIGGRPVRDCIACGACVKLGKCVFDDDMANEWAEKARNADGVVFGTPVYFAHASGRLQCLMDRMFYANRDAFEHKVGAVVAVARRAGAASALDNIEKHLTISNMVVAGSSYWNLAYGRAPEECKQDAEGMQTIRNLARNMAWIIKCLDMGKRNGLAVPKLERDKKMNFIR